MAAERPDRPEPRPLALDSEESWITESPAHEPPDAPSTAGRSRVGRIGVLAGAAGLVAGVALGWGAAMAVTAPDAPAATADGGVRAMAVSSADVRLSDTPAAGILDRPQADRDRPVASVDDSTGIDPASIRLLTERADGTRVFIARAGDEVCLLAEAGDTLAGGDCTVDGAVPPNGLSVTLPAPHAGVVATWDLSGAVRFSDAG